MKKILNDLSKSQKITCLIAMLCLVLCFSFVFPSIARFKNRNISPNVIVWDGSVATGYKQGNGSKNNPYIISTGSELAYFSEKLLENNYENTYFKLSNDIILNKGLFKYNNDELIYYLNDNDYYVDISSNKYYDNKLFEGNEIGTINNFNFLNGFKGVFDADSYRIFGLYISALSNDKVALFTDLEGTITDLYVENSFIYGGNITGGIASNASNSSILNVLMDGYVIGKNDEIVQNIKNDVSVSAINIQNTSSTHNIDLRNSMPLMGSEIISTSLNGKYVFNGIENNAAVIKINGVEIQNGEFQLPLGNSILDFVELSVEGDSLGDAILTFQDVSYSIVYKYAISGGIVASGDNLIIKNSINKASVFGNSTSGGLIGVANGAINITQSYNTGFITSENVSGGLIGNTEKSESSVTISKCYNAGNISSSIAGGLIGSAINNKEPITINNSFDISSNNIVANILNTDIITNNVYYTSGLPFVNNNINLVTLDNLKDEQFLNTNLSFDKFNNYDDLKINNQNVWVYEKDHLPILFIDDINEPLAKINSASYSWTNLSFDITSLRFENNIVFNIESISDFSNVKEKYYYISNAKEALTSEEIENINSWVLYDNNVIQIDEEGFYVIYAKIVDQNDNVQYINSDLLLLDHPGVNAKIVMGNYEWDDLRDNLSNKYIDKATEIKIELLDLVSEVKSVKYYLTNLKQDDLSRIKTWTNYEENIIINTIGNYYLYVQIIDGFNDVTYINSDQIIFDGYVENSYVGRNNFNYLDNNKITNKSLVTFEFKYDGQNNLEGTYFHNLKSNILLPFKTKITMIDNIDKRVYQYEVETANDIYGYNDSCDNIDCREATYALSVFKEIGNVGNNKFNKDGLSLENYTFIVDFSNTDLVTNLENIVLYMEVLDNDNVTVRPTLNNTIKPFNIYSKVNEENTNGTIYISTDYTGSGIILNSNQETTFKINTGIDYKKINNELIIDTSYEDKQLGLVMEFVNNEGNVVDEDFKNLVVKIENNTYYPKEGKYYINLIDNITSVTKDITILTYDDTNNISEGVYYLKIYSFASYDGYYENNFKSDFITIPIIVNKNYHNIDYNFNVLMDDNLKIINKSESNKMIFNILKSGNIPDSNIRVSLYKKNDLTAYNQDYTIVDLQKHVYDNLNKYGSNIYYLSEGQFELNLNGLMFENTGYKLVFDLYSNNNKLNTIEKYFIVR